MNKTILLPLLLASASLLAACQDKAPEPGASSTISSTATPLTTEAWLGKWHGPEGTFIDISGGNGTYAITIKDLDGSTHYQGTGMGTQITFERNGTTETLQASTGADTGMKWLANKSDCLRVREGEGWCRD